MLGRPRRLYAAETCGAVGRWGSPSTAIIGSQGPHQRPHSHSRPPLVEGCGRPARCADRSADGGGLQYGLPRPEQRKLDGDAEAHLIAVACSPPPVGRAHWTLRLLADRMVQLQYADSLSHETVRTTLKKTN